MDDPGAKSHSATAIAAHGEPNRKSVESGARVEANQPVIVLEAMKMEHTLRAPSSGTVVSFRFAAGEQVDEGAELVDFRADED